MPIIYWCFVTLTLLLVSVVGYGAYTTNRLLRAWQPDLNLLLIPSETILRLMLVGLCILLGLLSKLSWAQLGWVFADGLEQLLIGFVWGGGLALFFYGATRWVIRYSGQRFYSTVVIKAIVPQNRRELLLVTLAMLPVVSLEELLFRSLLLGGLTPILPAPILVVAAGVLFGVMHLPQGVWGVVGAAAAGILFGWLFLHTSSLLTPLVAHYIANVAQLAQAMRLRDQL